jgi:UDP-N-acetylglucosamine 2-epimerase
MLMLMLGDRFEILAAATAAHLQRVPIAHIGGGDVTEGSMTMRCATALAAWHPCIS